MHRVITVTVRGVAATLLLSSAIAAQSVPRPFGAYQKQGENSVLPIIRPPDSVPPSSRVQLGAGFASDGRPMPTWLKWGIVGAGAGAVTFAVLGRATIDRDPNPVLQDAALGAAIGFLVVGGSVAFYSWVCGPGSASRRAGLCGR